LFAAVQIDWRPNPSHVRDRGCLVNYTSPCVAAAALAVQAYSQLHR
jgi:hypothetical protein